MRYLWTFAFLVFFAVPALAQDEDCPAKCNTAVQACFDKVSPPVGRTAGGSTPGLPTNNSCGEVYSPCLSKCTAEDLAAKNYKVPPDVAALQAAAEKGNVAAQQKLCVGSNPYKPDLLWCHKAMESGDSLSAQKYRMSRGMEDCLRSGVDAEKVKAEQGELSSQIQFGLDSYTGGCGISQDYAEAYFWLSLILKNEKTPRNGKINYAFWRDDAAKHLTSDQIAAIDKRLAEWKPPRDEH